MKQTLNIFKIIVLIFAIPILLYLSLGSLFVNAKLEVSQVSEKTVFVHTLWFLLLSALIIFIAVIYKLKDKISSLNTGKLAKILIAYTYVFTTCWIIIANVHEGSDQGQVFKAAQQMLNGDFSTFNVDGYMGIYPFQLGLALLYQPFFLLFGNTTAFVWQLINVFLICFIQFFLYKITCMMTEDRFSINLFLILEFLDIPLLLFVSFVYGTIIGHSLALTALFFLMKACKNEDHTILNILASVFFITFSALVRNNNLIIIIAMCILVIGCFLDSKRGKLLLFIPLVVISFSISHKAVFEYYEWACQGQYTNIGSYGQPTALAVAMGLSENDELANGWFNGYTWDKYIELGCDPKVAEEFAIERISESLGRFAASPSYTFSFFAEKLNSMWLNPDFQSLWNSGRHGNYIGESPVIYNLYYGELNILIESIMSIVMFIIYLGSFLYILLGNKKISWQNMIFAMILIGGFLFHLFWEAKAQYTIVYYVILFPYAAMGYSLLISKHDKRQSQH